MPLPTRRRFLQSIGLAATASLAGCSGSSATLEDQQATVPNANSLAGWPTVRGDARRSAVVSATGPGESPGFGWSFTADQEPPFGRHSTPVVADGGVFVTDLFNGVLYRLAPDGSVEWRTDLQSQNTCEPAIVGDRVVVGDGVSLRAFSLDGTAQWQTHVAGAVLGIAPGEETLVTTTPKGVVGVALDDGHEKWAVETDLLQASPAVADGRAFVGDMNGVLHAIDVESGDRLWRFSVDHDWIQAAPVVDDGIVYVGSGTEKLDAGGLYAVVAADGTQNWSREFPENSVYHEPAVGDGELFVTTFDGTLHAVDTNDGTDYWKYSPPGADADGSGFPLDFAPTLADGTVYFTSQKYDLHALSAREPSKSLLGDVEPEWTVGGRETGTQFVGSPVVAGESLLAATGTSVVLLGPTEDR